MRVDDEGRNIAIVWEVEGRKTPKRGQVKKTAQIEVNNKYEMLHFDPEDPEIPDFEQSEQIQTGGWGDTAHDKVMIGPRGPNTKAQEESAMSARKMFSVLKEVATMLKEEESNVVSNAAEVIEKKKWISKSRKNISDSGKDVADAKALHGEPSDMLNHPEQDVCPLPARKPLVRRTPRQGEYLDDE